MASEEQNLQTVQGFYASFLDGTLFDYISGNFTEDVEYMVITPTLGINNPADYADETFTHEGQNLAVVLGFEKNSLSASNFVFTV